MAGPYRDKAYALSHVAPKLAPNVVQRLPTVRAVGIVLTIPAGQSGAALWPHLAGLNTDSAWEMPMPDFFGGSLGA